MAESFLKAHLGSMEKAANGTYKTKPLAALPDGFVFQLDPTKPPIQENVLVVSKENFETAIKDTDADINVIYGSSIFILDNEGKITRMTTSIQSKDPSFKQGSMEKRKDAI